jgi:carbon storage regulator
MLVIRRKAGESLLIGDGIEIEVIDVSPSRVKLGIKAPEDVTILRKEIRDAAEHNREAARRVTASTIQDLVARLR